MPADSRPARPESPGVPSLPQRWRPLGVRLAVYFFGALLIVVSVVAWNGIPPRIQAKLTIWNVLTMGSVGVLYLTAGWALARSRLDATTSGLVVVNGFRSYRFSWAEVVAVRHPRGAPWVTLDVADGSTRSVLALQTADGVRTASAVRELRALVHEHATGPA